MTDAAAPPVGSASPPPVTALYVPADRPERISKALAAGADIVIVDLEDAVAPSHKLDARDGLAVLARETAAVVQVRVNARGTPWWSDDLRAVSLLPPAVGVRVPKVESVDDVAAVRAAAPGRGIHPLLESALGIERAFDISAAGVSSIGLGEADLRSQFGLPSGSGGEPGLQWARSRVVNAAAAVGLAAPMMSVVADLADEAGLAASCAVGRALGFVGRAAIHPRQLPVIESAFAPTEEEVLRAREIVARVESARHEGHGTVVLDDGTFLDIAMVASARRVLMLEVRLGRR